MTSLKGEVGHTPGPWSYDSGLIPPDGPGYYADIYVDGGDTIIASFNREIPEGQANARLISAAPDLLEALKGAEAWLDRWAVHVGSCAGGERCSCGLTANQFEARAAIAKASALTSLKD